MSEINTGRPAFPIPGLHRDESFNGMTLRQYAAIELKVPNSGTDWLDEMIIESQRNEFAAKAMQGVLSHHLTVMSTHEAVALQAYTMADAILKARKA